LVLIVAAEGENRNAPGGGRARDGRQYRPQGEDHRDRLICVHDDDPGDVPMLTTLPASMSRIPVRPSNGAADRGVVEVDLGIVYERLIGGDGGLELTTLRLLRCRRSAGWRNRAWARSRKRWRSVAHSQLRLVALLIRLHLA